MDTETIILKPIAFEGILRSVYETVRKSESFGYLFGEIYEKRNKHINWIVESAIPVQIVKRVPQSIYCDDETEKRCKMPVITENIGDFHSHIPYRILQNDGLRTEMPGEYRISETDEKELSPDKISLIVGLKKVKKMGLLVDDPFLISGYLRDNKILYRIDMGGYYFNKRKRRAILKTPKKALKMIR